MNDIEVLRSTIKMIITKEMNYITNNENYEQVHGAKNRIISLIDKQFDDRIKELYPVRKVTHRVSRS